MLRRDVRGCLCNYDGSDGSGGGRLRHDGVDGLYLHGDGIGRAMQFDEHGDEDGDRYDEHQHRRRKRAELLTNTRLPM